MVKVKRKKCRPLDKNELNSSELKELQNDNTSKLKKDTKDEEKKSSKTEDPKQIEDMEKVKGPSDIKHVILNCCTRAIDKK